MRLNNLNFAWHLNHGTLIFHGAVSLSFGGGNVNHVALLLVVAVRLLNIVGNSDLVAFGLLVTIGFRFVVGKINSVAFLFAVINIDGLGGWDLNFSAFLNLGVVRLFDCVGYIK